MTRDESLSGFRLLNSTTAPDVCPALFNKRRIFGCSEFSSFRYRASDGCFESPCSPPLRPLPRPLLPRFLPAHSTLRPVAATPSAPFRPSTSKTSSLQTDLAQTPRQLDQQRLLLLFALEEKAIRHPLQPVAQRLHPQSNTQSGQQIDGKGRGAATQHALQSVRQTQHQHTKKRLSIPRQQQRIHQGASDQDADVKEMVRHDGINAKADKKQRTDWPQPDPAVVAP